MNNIEHFHKWMRQPEPFYPAITYMTSSFTLASIIHKIMYTSFQPFGTSFEGYKQYIQSRLLILLWLYHPHEGMGEVLAANKLTAQQASFDLWHQFLVKFHQNHLRSLDS